MCCIVQYIVLRCSRIRELTSKKRAMVISALVEGNSINSTARMCSVSKLTVLRLLPDIGSLCRDFHDIKVRRLSCQRVRADEIGSSCGAKQKNVQMGKQVHGDVWTWVAMDAETKLAVSYLFG